MFLLCLCRLVDAVTKELLWVPILLFGKEKLLLRHLYQLPLKLRVRMWGDWLAWGWWGTAISIPMAALKGSLSRVHFFLMAAIVSLSL